MAGIGFSLNRLFQKKGVLNLCRAYAYAGAVAIGPMVMGVCLLLGISFVSQVAGMPQGQREIMNCMLTYSLLVSLFVSSFFNMISGFSRKKASYSFSSQRVNSHSDGSRGVRDFRLRISSRMTAAKITRKKIPMPASSAMTCGVV